MMWRIQDRKGIKFNTYKHNIFLFLEAAYADFPCPSSVKLSLTKIVDNGEMSGIFLILLAITALGTAFLRGRRVFYAGVLEMPLQ